MVIVVLIATPQAKKAALERAETLRRRGIARRLGKTRRAGTPAHPPDRHERSAAEGLAILAYP